MPPRRRRPSSASSRAQTIEVETAIRAIVTKSANDVAVIVAEALGGNEAEFAKLMTAKARALGMTHTVYRNASGLPDDEQITTARDQAILGRAIAGSLSAILPLLLHPHVRVPRQGDAQSQSPARPRRRRRRHQDRLHPRLRLQHRHLDAPRRTSPRRRGVRRPHRRRRAMRACASLIDNNINTRRGQAHGAAGSSKAGRPRGARQGQPEAKDIKEKVAAPRRALAAPRRARARLDRSDQAQPGEDVHGAAPCARASPSPTAAPDGRKLMPAPATNPSHVTTVAIVKRESAAAAERKARRARRAAGQDRLRRRAAFRSRRQRRRAGGQAAQRRLDDPGRRFPRGERSQAAPGRGAGQGQGPARPAPIRSPNGWRRATSRSIARALPAWTRIRRKSPASISSAAKFRACC